MDRLLISMAHNLKFKVIAEGVETLEQKNFLMANGCLEFQGYLYSKPLPADDFFIYVNNKKKKRPY